MHISIKSVVFLFSLILSLNTLAEEKGFYVGGSVGHTSIDTLSEGQVNANLAAGGITATSNVDDTDMGWKLFGGYNFNQYFGLELGYVDLGEASLDITATAPAAATASVSAEADGFQFTGIARYPLMNNFDVFGKVGGFVWDVEGGGSVTSGATTVVVSAEDDGSSIMFGFGAEYELQNNIGIRAEWERFEVSSDDVDMFSIGVEYDF